MVDSNDKVVQGVLYEWESHMQSAKRIRGRTAIDNPRTGTMRGNWIVTSEVLRFFRVGGVLHAETLNSIYMLVDEDPFKRS